MAEHAFAQPSSGQLPSEIPAKFEAVTGSFDYLRRDVMIAMRDGVKLHTIIILPKSAKGAPILLTRTPYSAKELTSHAESGHMESILTGYDNATDVIMAGGYIRVVQDIRGKYGSEGDYVMNRPLRGPLNPTEVDHATDTFDTIEWLVKNVPESNGRVGIMGISYDGYLPLMALVNPHPALKVAVPMNPMVDGWMGDDWFHNGAFRQVNMDYIYGQEGKRESDEKWWSSHYDEYDMFMQGVSAGALGRSRGLEQTGFWRKVVEHPSYDSFWRDQAVDKILGMQPLKVPVMLVHSLWDQEDIYGAIAVYKAIKPKDTGEGKVFLVMGPWSHGQAIHDGSSLGALKFDSDTALYFRREILGPFLDHYLKDGASHTAPVIAFETGSNRWRQYTTWPASCEEGCPDRMKPIYLQPGFRLSFSNPEKSESSFDEYVSDPAKPVTYRARPIRPGYAKDSTWSQWLVDDQRNYSDRPDVLTYGSEALMQPVTISGQPIARLFASSSGTDCDWVIKLIDVFPDEVPSNPVLGGYQLMVSADIMRGRYRKSLEHPSPIPADKVEEYRMNMPTANHVFLPGHRIMVQIQSTWFPLYDRNPQTYVENIFWAKPGDYQKATQRIFRTAEQASRIDLPLQTGR